MNKKIILGLMISLNFLSYSMEDDKYVKDQAFSVYGIEKITDKNEAKKTLSNASSDFYQNNLAVPRVQDLNIEIQKQYLSFLKEKKELKGLNTKEEKNLDYLRNILGETNSDVSGNNYLSQLKKNTQNPDNKQIQTPTNTPDYLVQLKNRVENPDKKQIQKSINTPDYLGQLKNKVENPDKKQAQQEEEKGVFDFKALAYSDIQKRTERNNEIKRKHQEDLNRMMELAKANKNQKSMKDLNNAQLDLQKIDQQLEKIKLAVAKIDSNQEMQKDLINKIEAKSGTIQGIMERLNSNIINPNLSYISNNHEDINGYNTKYQSALNRNGMENLLSEEKIKTLSNSSNTEEIQKIIFEICDVLEGKINAADNNLKKDIIYITKKIINILETSSISSSLTNLKEKVEMKINEIDQQKQDLENQEIALKSSQEELTNKINLIKAELEQ